MEAVCKFLDTSYPWRYHQKLLEYTLQSILPTDVVRLIVAAVVAAEWSALADYFGKVELPHVWTPHGCRLATLSQLELLPCKEDSGMFTYKSKKGQDLTAYYPVIHKIDSFTTTKTIWNHPELDAVGQLNVNEDDDDYYGSPWETHEKAKALKLARNMVTPPDWSAGYNPDGPSEFNLACVNSNHDPEDESYITAAKALIDRAFKLFVGVCQHSHLMTWES
eukprot:TRINITY_DN19389_c0_g1_i2.p1 TRINITY_DN19389_c0_g1~~TRINITY_DN19389_c0_g1_i2.p1  ORF type:complete len:229 (-),score=11.49 TRINITY_DN19389_c0_g1_i2:25-687(-)